MSTYDPSNFSPMPGMRLASAPGLSSPRQASPLNRKTPPKSRSSPNQRGGPNSADKHSAARREGAKSPNDANRSAVQWPPKTGGTPAKQLSAANGKPNNGGNSSSKKNKKNRHITFLRGANETKFVTPPPKEENDKYWFTETQRKVLKELEFEVEKGSCITIEVDRGMRLCSIIAKADSPSAAAGRTHLYVSEMDIATVQLPVQAQNPNTPKIGKDGSFRPNDKAPWYCIGSADTTRTEPIKAQLHTGAYFLRVRGPHPIHVFADVIDVERQLV